MKIEILIGSPRKKGNTFLLANALIYKLPNKTVTVSITYLYDYSIEPCSDCRGCKRGDLTCVIDDDTNEIYQKLESADVIIFGTPIYWFGPTAKTKLLIDRLRPYFVNRKLAGKKAALLLTAGDGEKDCDLTIEMFKRIFETLGIEYLGVVTSKAYDIGDANNDLYLSVSIKKLSFGIVQ